MGSNIINNQNSTTESDILKFSSLIDLFSFAQAHEFCGGPCKRELCEFFEGNRMSLIFPDNFPFHGAERIPFDQQGPYVVEIVS